MLLFLIDFLMIARPHTCSPTQKRKPWIYPDPQIEKPEKGDLSLFQPPLKRRETNCKI
jgi:hypothetical protein